MLEKDLQKLCEDWLKEKDYPYIHIPNRLFLGNKNKSILELKGWPDFCPVFLPNGKKLIIELKIDSDFKMKQVERIIKLHDFGHRVHLITSFDEFKSLIEEEA